MPLGPEFIVGILQGLAETGFMGLDNVEVHELHEGQTSTSGQNHDFASSGDCAWQCRLTCSPPGAQAGRRGSSAVEDDVARAEEEGVETVMGGELRPDPTDTAASRGGGGVSCSLFRLLDQILPFNLVAGEDGSIVHVSTSFVLCPCLSVHSSPSYPLYMT